MANDKEDVQKIISDLWNVIHKLYLRAFFALYKHIYMQVWNM